jgi:hypothetical protein
MRRSRESIRERSSFAAAREAEIRTDAFFVLKRTVTEEQKATF